MGDQFLTLPPDICGDSGLPAFPQNPDCTGYDQLFAEVSGIVVLPDGVDPAEDWGTVEDWGAVIDNSDAGSDKAKYLVGIGSLTELDSAQISLAGGREIRNNIHSYQLNLNVLNMDGGHILFAKKCQRNKRNFRVFIETLGGRMIGGPYGLKPYYVNAILPFQQGQKEQIQFRMNFSWAAFPNMS
jgi:hypothetical protein